jgi:hypothetical protein
MHRYGRRYARDRSRGRTETATEARASVDSPVRPVGCGPLDKASETPTKTTPGSLAGKGDHPPGAFRWRSKSDFLIRTGHFEPVQGGNIPDVSRPYRPFGKGVAPVSEPVTREQPSSAGRHSIRHAPDEFSRSLVPHADYKGQLPERRR